MKVKGSFQMVIWLFNSCATPLPLPLFNHVWVHQCNICVIYGLRHICRSKKQSTDSDLKTDPLTNLIPRQMIVHLSLCGKVAACYHHLLQVTKIRGGFGGEGGFCTLLDMALLLKLSPSFRLLGCLDVSPTLVVTSPFYNIGVYLYLCLCCKKYSTVRCTVFVAVP